MPNLNVVDTVDEINLIEDSLLEDRSDQEGSTESDLSEDSLFEGDQQSNIVGTDGSDELIGTSGDDTILAFGGDDIIKGSTGNDILDGGDGFDTVDYRGTGQQITIFPAGAFDDGGESTLVNIEKIIGDEGQKNTINVKSVSSSTSLNVNLENNTAVAENVPGIGSLGFEVENFDYVFGTNNDDSIVGDDGNFNLLVGRNGNDFIDGGDGKDEIRGGQGDDTLVGGTGRNIITGGSGADSFVVDSSTFDDSSTLNVVKDFDINSDVLVSNEGLGISDLTFSGSNIIDNESGRVVFTLNGVNTEDLSSDNFQGFGE